MVEEWEYDRYIQIPYLVDHHVVYNELTKEK